jgi:hypothetical protein
MMGNRPAKYVIINETDAPEPAMVCQWVSGIGYCYLDRREPKPRYDGMSGDAATPIEAFGFAWTEEKADGTVFIFWSGAPVTATYSDGRLRRWQSDIVMFTHRQLVCGAMQKRPAT